MDQSDTWRLLESDWYSPRRLHDSPTQYDFPGDRFLPNRSLMDLDKAQSLFTNRTRVFNTSKWNQAYRQKLIENLSLDSEGRPFRIMVFRGSPKSGRKSIRFVDEIRQEDAAVFDNYSKQAQYRYFPKGEKRILDAPGFRNDYYVNIMSWGKNNILAVALGPELYLWNSEDQSVYKLLKVGGRDDWPTSVTWSEDARTLAVGYMCSKLELWDAESSKLIRNLQGHRGRIASTAWNGHILTSGSGDKSIINNDVRAGNHLTSCIKRHAGEVCGLKWSIEGNRLASGGNDNLIYIWEASKISSSKFLHRLNDHCAAVKALAWSPYHHNVLASGGGLNDGCIKIWNTQNGICINSIETKAQTCGSEWNRHHNEILSGHGYSTRPENQNKLCLWRYPSMTKVGELGNHGSRIINLCQSPDGVTVISAAADETLRFWDVFGPPTTRNSVVSDLQGLLSLRTSPIR
ncbi:hypothetical protein REPUB_Repub07fG0013100 [Reevesia pubescens]